MGAEKDTPPLQRDDGGVHGPSPIRAGGKEVGDDKWVQHRPDGLMRTNFVASASSVLGWRGGTPNGDRMTRGNLLFALAPHSTHICAALIETSPTHIDSVIACYICTSLSILYHCFTAVVPSGRQSV